MSGIYGYVSFSLLAICKLFIQVAYGPTRYSEIGLSDGEVMERLWSYLRRFSRMTKEMRPSHRIDVLSQALWYYGQKTKRKFGNQFDWCIS